MSSQPAFSISASFPGPNARGRAPSALDREYPWFGRGRLSDVVWTEYRRHVPDLGRLCRQDPEGRKTSRPPGPIADEIRADHQSENRKGARPDNSAVAPRPRRRGHRVNRLRLASLRSQRRAYSGRLIAVRPPEGDWRLWVPSPQSELSRQSYDCTSSSATELDRPSHISRTSAV